MQRYRRDASAASYATASRILPLVIVSTRRRVCEQRLGSMRHAGTWYSSHDPRITMTFTPLLTTED